MKQIMSIKFSVLAGIISLIIFSAPCNSSAAVGYEESTNVMIDTNHPVSEIDIGNDIIYYDFADEKYYNAFVELKDNTTSGIRIEVEEIETKKKRVFLIDYDN